MVGKKYWYVMYYITYQYFIIFGPKLHERTGPTPSNAPHNDVAPLKIITYRAIKTTGTLIVKTVLRILKYGFWRKSTEWRKICKNQLFWCMQNSSSLTNAGDRNKIAKCIINMLEQVSATRHFPSSFKRNVLWGFLGFQYNKVDRCRGGGGGGERYGMWCLIE